jgi:hypothetical protein
LAFTGVVEEIAPITKAPGWMWIYFLKIKGVLVLENSEIDGDRRQNTSQEKRRLGSRPFLEKFHL